MTKLKQTIRAVRTAASNLFSSKVVDAHNQPIVIGNLYRTIDTGELIAFTPGSIVRVCGVYKDLYPAPLGEPSLRCILIFGSVYMEFFAVKYSDAEDTQYVVSGRELEALDDVAEYKSTG